MKFDIPVEEVERYLESLHTSEYLRKVKYVEAVVEEQSEPGTWTFKLTYKFAEAP